jgi:DMSO reductase anchor subunit
LYARFLGQGAGVFALGYLVDGPGYRAAFAAVAAAVALLTGWMQRAVFDRSRDTSPRT